MKRMTQIAKELREYGCMFSQTTFANDLLSVTPEFKGGNVTFFPDDTAEKMACLYKRRTVKPLEVEAPAVEVVEPTYSRLEHIEHMLENLTGYMNMNNPDYREYISRSSV